MGLDIKRRGEFHYLEVILGSWSFVIFHILRRGGR